MAAKNYLYVDIETSGLKPEEGAVMLAIGAVATLKGKGNVGKVAEFEGYILPTEEQWKLASPSALVVNGLTWNLLREKGKPAVDVIADFASWLMDNKVDATSHTYVGQNPKFDLGFLKFYAKDALSFVGFPWENFIDNRDLYSILVNRKVMPWLTKESGGRKSENISTALGVEPEPFPHTALEGARVVKRNFDAMEKLGVFSTFQG